MTPAVLDTNAIVSGIGWSGPPRFILEATIPELFTWLMSQDLLDEVRRVLAYPKLRGLPQQRVQEVLALIPLIASMVEPEQRLTVVQRDPMDNIVLECAVVGEAAYIVTGGDLSPEIIASDPTLLGFRQLHDAIGRANIASPESLLELVFKTGSLPLVNLLVDI